MADQSNEMGMVEKVARALHVARYGEEFSWEALRDRAASPGYLVAKQRVNAMVAEARAAIEAMREPTYEMNFKGSLVGDYPWDGQRPSRIFTAMIDAALSHDEVKG